jgi:hypothetical protein
MRHVPPIGSWEPGESSIRGSLIPGQNGGNRARAFYPSGGDQRLGDQLAPQLRRDGSPKNPKVEAEQRFFLIRRLYIRTRIPYVWDTSIPVQNTFLVGGLSASLDLTAIPNRRSLVWSCGFSISSLTAGSPGSSGTM